MPLPHNTSNSKIYDLDTELLTSGGLESLNSARKTSLFNWSLVRPTPRLSHVVTDWRGSASLDANDGLVPIGV